MACNIPPAPVEKKSILKGVVTFVDVHSGHVNCSRIIGQHLQNLGATVLHTFNKKVTHVIFKEGGQGTYNKAKKLGVHLLSVTWVQSCLEKQEHVPEELYPAIVADAYDDCLIHVRKKKALEPIEFEEDMARSAALIKRRQRREFRRAIREKYLAPSSPALPDPKITEVKGVGTSEASHLSPSAVLSRFPAVPSDSSDDGSEDRIPPLVERLYDLYPDSPALLDLLSKRDKFKCLLSNSDLKKLETRDDSIGLFENGSLAASDSEVTSAVHSAMDRLQLQDEANKDGAECPTAVTPKLKCNQWLSGSARKRRREMLSPDEITSTLPLSNSISKDRVDSSVTRTAKDVPNDQSKKSNKIDMKSVVNEGALNVLYQDKSQPQNSKTKRELFIKINQNELNTVRTALAKEQQRDDRRTSLDDFKIIRRKKSKQVISPKIDSPVADCAIKQCDKLAVDTVASTPPCYPTKHIVLTNFSVSEKEILVPIATSLGGCRLSFTVNKSTTHVISGSNRRTLNVLLATVIGCWILKREWFFNSLEAGHWLDEGHFEMADEFPSAKTFRHQKILQPSAFKCTLFSTTGPIYVSQMTIMPREDLLALLELASAKIVRDCAAAWIAVGHIENDAGILCVSEQWILDSISKGEIQPNQHYLISSKK